MRIWRGRHAGSLLIAWAVAFVLVGGLRTAENIQPALGDLLPPIYAIIVAALIFVTWRWFRARSGNRRDDRRHVDRRLADRRDPSDRGAS